MRAPGATASVEPTGALGATSPELDGVALLESPGAEEEAFLLGGGLELSSGTKGAACGLNRMVGGAFGVCELMIAANEGSKEGLGQESEPRAVCATS